MRMKRKKLSASTFFSKKKNLLLYQNLWHLSKLTKKQKKWVKYQKKIYSTELGRPIRKYRIFRIFTKSFPFNKEYYWKKRREEKKNNPQRRFARIKTCPQLFHNPRVWWNSKKGLSSKKALCLILKPFWFLNKAIPIPGISSLKKANVLFQEKLFAYKMLKSWLGTLNKKQRITLFSEGKKQNLSKNWNTILLIESLYESIPRKISFCLNRPQRNSMYKARQSKNRVVNGNMKGNNSILSKPADLFFRGPVKNTRLLTVLSKNRNSFFKAFQKK